MPGEFDLTEYGNLRDIPGMLRQMGVPYTTPTLPAQSQAPAAGAGAGAASIPMLLQYLSAIAPWAMLGGAGMAQGGSAAPGVSQFYANRGQQAQRAGERAPMPMGMQQSSMLQRMRPLTPLRQQPRRPLSPAPRQPFAF